MSRMGDYDHLNNDDPLSIDVNMDDLADRLIAMNYGVIRFLAALVRARRRKPNRHPKPDELANGIEELLNRGLY